MCLGGAQATTIRHARLLGYTTQVPLSLSLPAPLFTNQTPPSFFLNKALALYSTLLNSNFLCSAGDEAFLRIAKGHSYA